eukprot:6214634-Pleurochrysis_carterae.AAC.1
MNMWAIIPILNERASWYLHGRLGASCAPLPPFAFCNAQIATVKFVTSLVAHGGPSDRGIAYPKLHTLNAPCLQCIGTL